MILHAVFISSVGLLYSLSVWCVVSNGYLWLIQIGWKYSVFLTKFNRSNKLRVLSISFRQGQLSKWFTVKSPESHLAQDYAARNRSYVAHNFYQVARNAELCRPKIYLAQQYPDFFITLVLSHQILNEIHYITPVQHNFGRDDFRGDLISYANYYRYVPVVFKLLQ